MLMIDQIRLEGTNGMFLHAVDTFFRSPSVTLQLDGARTNFEQWELVFLAVLGLLLITCLLPETLPTNILHERAQRFRRTMPRRSSVTHEDLKEDKSSLISTIGGLFV